jgi:PII-like signaling protein
MWCLIIRIKRNDQFHGRSLYKSLLEFLMQAKISGATVWTGVDGYGKRQRSMVHLEGLTINMPMVIEVIMNK